VARIQDIDIPYLEFGEAAAPGTPAAGIVRIYTKTDGVMYQKDDAGTETSLAAGATFAGVRAIPNATTSLTTATWTAIALAGTDRFDTDGYHDPASNNTRLTVPTGKDGYYHIGANGQIAGNTTGERGIRILLNGATIIAVDLRPTLADVALPWRGFISTVYNLVATNYVEMQLWQDSGVSVSTENLANATNEFWMYKVG
jgi:hypothetical protein